MAGAFGGSDDDGDDYEDCDCSEPDCECDEEDVDYDDDDELDEDEDDANEESEKNSDQASEVAKGEDTPVEVEVNSDKKLAESISESLEDFEDEANKKDDASKSSIDQVVVYIEQLQF